jgi:hypothetical protein
MKRNKILAIAISTIIMVACGTSKSKVIPSVSNTPVEKPKLVVKPSNGIYAPGQEELAAIQVQFQDATLDHLKQGYTIYSEGACVKCHAAENIYRFSEIQWKMIVEDMAKKARISDAEKDAVYKYVLAIKATQSK